MFFACKSKLLLGFMTAFVLNVKKNKGVNRKENYMRYYKMTPSCCLFFVFSFFFSCIQIVGQTFINIYICESFCLFSYFFLLHLR